MEIRHEVLEEEECRRLLAGEHVGRLGVVIDDYPVVLPMHYALEGDWIVLRTNAGSKFHSAPMTRVTFEVDRFDLQTGEGWSVVVEGTAEDISRTIDERSERARAIPIRTWARPPADCWLAVIPRSVTGRRITTS